MRQITKNRISSKMTKSDIFALLSENQAQKRSMYMNSCQLLWWHTQNQSFRFPNRSICVRVALQMLHLQYLYFTAGQFPHVFWFCYWHSWAFVYPPLHRNTVRIASWMHHVTLTQRVGLKRANQIMMESPTHFCESVLSNSSILKLISDSRRCKMLFLKVK